MQGLFFFFFAETCKTIKTRLLTQNPYKSWFLESLMDTHDLGQVPSTAYLSLEKENCQSDILSNKENKVSSFGTTSNVYPC